MGPWDFKVPWAPTRRALGCPSGLPRRELVYLRVGFVPPWATGVGDREAWNPVSLGSLTWLMKQCMNHVGV